jgi:hypothetical protein
LIWSVVPASMVALSTLKVWFSPLIIPHIASNPGNKIVVTFAEILTRFKCWPNWGRKTDQAMPRLICIFLILHSKVIIFFASNAWVYVKQSWQVWRSWMLGGAILSKIQMSSIFLVCFYQYAQPS